MYLREAIARQLGNQSRRSGDTYEREKELLTDQAKELVQTFKHFLLHNLDQTILNASQIKEIMQMLDEEHMP